jgi:hypothetical protein
MRKSRNGWKEKAVARATRLRDQSKKLIRLLRRLETQRQLILQLEAENAALRSTSIRSASQLPVPIQIIPRIHLRTLCVMMVISGIVSFRAVPRLLGVFQLFSSIQVQVVPHFTSVIHWSLRAGLAVFNQVSIIQESWVAIIDCSIDVGTRKALVVLRVPLLALSRKLTAIGLEDCQCIGVKIASVWNGEQVKNALTEIFAQAGMPRAILKDGGTDLNKGVRLYRETAGAKKIWVLEDVGHAAANALKAEFSKRSAFTKFLEIVRKGAARIRQTDLAWLSPPKIRTKGRFQGITTVAEWAEKLLDVMGGQGRSKDNSQSSGLRKAFRGLSQLRSFLEQFGATCRVTEQLLEIMKQRGINQKSYVEAKALLEQLSGRSKVRTSLLSWLDRHLRLQCRLGIGQIPLMVSSDVIESLFGKFKTIIQRNPQAELNRLIYIIPLLCGSHTAAEIDRGLWDCSHLQLLKRIKQDIPQTLRQQRHRGLDSAPLDQVPKTGELAGLEAG